MVGGLRAPPEDEEQAAALQQKGGVYFVLESAELQVGKVGKVCIVNHFHSGRPACCMLATMNEMACVLQACRTEVMCAMHCQELHG